MADGTWVERGRLAATLPPRLTQELARAIDRQVRHLQGGKAEAVLAKGLRRLGEDDELGKAVGDLMEEKSQKTAMTKSPLDERWTDGTHRWCTTHSGRFRYGQHINLSGADALLLYIRALAKCSETHEHKACVFNDSQVVVGATMKGRSSSRALLRKVRRIGALSMASRISLGLRYINSASNPADEPSRRR